VDHFIWFFYFAHVTQESRRPSHRLSGYSQPAKHVHGFAEIATFFGICVWLAPLFLFLSLSANDNALPVTAGKNYDQDIISISSRHHAVPSGENGPRYDSMISTRSSLFKSIFSTIFEYLPGLRKSSRRDAPEGLIAPRSPLPQGSFGRDSSPIPSSSNPLPPPSPGGPPKNTSDVDSHYSPGFRLNTPPPRSSPMRRVTTDAAGGGKLYPREKIS
jgi:Transmembrane adaptor Erv26